MAFGSMKFSGLSFLANAANFFSGGTVFDKLCAVANTVASNSSTDDCDELNQTLVAAVASYTTSDYSIFNEYITNSYSGTKNMSAEVSAVAEHVLEVEAQIVALEEAQALKKQQEEEKAAQAAKEKAEREAAQKAKKEAEAEADSRAQSDETAEELPLGEDGLLDFSKLMGDLDAEIKAAQADIGKLAHSSEEAEATKEEQEPEEDEKTEDADSPAEEKAEDEPKAAEPEPLLKLDTREKLLRYTLLSDFYPSIEETTLANIAAFYDGEELLEPPVIKSSEEIKENASAQGDTFEATSSQDDALASALMAPCEE